MAINIRPCVARLSALALHAGANCIQTGYEKQQSCTSFCKLQSVETVITGRSIQCDGVDEQLQRATRNLVQILIVYKFPR